MPIKSYLAIPLDGKKEALMTEAQALSGCEVEGADNQEVVVLITSTPNEAAEKNLSKQLNELQNLKMLTLVSAFSE